MNETPLPVLKAVEYVASQYGMSVCCRTMVRWIRSGCFGIRLRAVKVGRQWSTTREAINEFISAVTAKSAPELVTVRTERQHDTDVDAARRELELGGFYGRQGRSN